MQEALAAGDNKMALTFLDEATNSYEKVQDTDPHAKEQLEILRRMRT